MKYDVAAPVVAVQQNHIKFEVSVPPRVKTALESRFGARVLETVAATLAMLSEGDVLIIPDSDLQRMKERLGKKPESSGELFGLIYNVGMELESAQLARDNAEKDLKAYEGRAYGMSVIDLGKNFQNANERARAENLPLKIWLEQRVANALENNWF
jgi:hypothetical protein